MSNCTDVANADLGKNEYTSENIGESILTTFGFFFAWKVKER